MTSRRLLIALLGATALLVGWSLLVPWAAAFPSTPDHYKVSLFGVRHIMDMSATSMQVTCSWGDPVVACHSRAGGDRAFQAVAQVRWYMAATAVLTLICAAGIRRRSRRTVVATAAAVSLLAIMSWLSMRANVVAALAVFDSARAVLPGPGMTTAALAAFLAAVLCLLAVRQRAW